MCFKDREIDKRYLCIVHGTPKPAAGTLEGYLFKDAVKNRVYVTKTPQKGAKTCATKYQVLQSKNGLSLVECELITGRTHQIRVQFASRGMPLVGDGKYGSRKNAASPALWSYALTLPGAGGKEERFCALPKMQGAWEPFSDALSRLDTLI